MTMKDVHLNGTKRNKLTRTKCTISFLLFATVTANFVRVQIQKDLKVKDSSSSSSSSSSSRRTTAASASNTSATYTSAYNNSLEFNPKTDCADVQANFSFFPNYFPTVSDSNASTATNKVGLNLVEKD